MTGACRVYVSEHGNVFMREIAEHLVEALQLVGRSASLVTSVLPEPDAGTTQLVIAPHEFFLLFPAAEADKERAAAWSTSINTEQPGTPFFDLAMRYARHGSVVFDINPLSLDAVRRAGVTAFHLPLGVVPSMDHWQRRDVERSVDLAFLGGRTPRRERFIGGAAGVLWEWRTDLRFFSWHRPVTGARPAFAVGHEKYEHLAATRILLNVHRGDEPYFEWARVLEAVVNGCVVASETSVGFEPLRPGRDVLMAPYDALAEEAVALAFDEPRRARMADAAYELVTRELDQTMLLERALALAEAQPRTAAPARPPRVRRARPVPEPERTADRHVLEHTAKELKAAYLGQVAITRGIERALAAHRFGDADHVSVTVTPAWSQVAPDVSVVIPLYQQGSYLAEAVDSVVAASAGGAPAVELIVVDDHSTDDSLVIALDLIAARPWLPAQVVARSANGGLPVARNTGFAAARAPFVFALDADNVLYPNGLRTLHAHLSAAPDDVIAAYGLLERFDEGGAVGLTSHLPWDVDLLVLGAYIDAMALVRRRAWEALGGYATSTDVYGWEDYDLWLAAAERGWRAELVPQIVGRYREQPGSMRRISDIDMATNFVALRERHPRLPWPS